MPTDGEKKEERKGTNKEGRRRRRKNEEATGEGEMLDNSNRKIRAFN